MNEFERVRKSILINPVKPSYAILTNDTIVDFELGNTPMSNLGTIGSSITLNGTSYQKTTIKEIIFGSSYRSITYMIGNFLTGCTSITSVDLSVFKNVNSIGASFLYNCSSLLSVDLSVFKNITSISGYFLSGCRALTSVDLSAFVNVTSIGYNVLNNCTSIISVDLSALVNITSIGSTFLYNCSALKTFYIGTVVPPTIASSIFSYSAIQNIYVPAQSVNAYKTATKWSNFANIISAI